MFNQPRGIFGAPVRRPFDPLANPMPNDGNPYPMDEQPPAYTTPMGARVQIDPNIGGGSIFAGAARKPTAFEPGGIGRNIIGGLGDALATWSGGQANFHDGQMMKQKQAFAQAEADRQRAAEFADWTKRQDYEVAHPKPANNDTVNDYEFYKSKYGGDWADHWLKFNAANVRQPDGTYVSASNGWDASPLPALPPGVTVDAPTTGGAAPKGSATFPIR